MNNSILSMTDIRKTFSGVAVLDEVEFDLSHDKVLEDHDWPELIEDE